MTACHECDLLHRLKPIPRGTVARCSRCGAVLSRHRPNSLERTLALTVAGLILFALANTFPFLAMTMEGQYRQIVLLTGIKELYLQGMQEIAILVLLTTVVTPLLHLTGLLYVLVPLKLNRMAPAIWWVFRWVRRLQPWSMLEVFMLGILVAPGEADENGGRRPGNLTLLLPGPHLYPGGRLRLPGSRQGLGEMVGTPMTKTYATAKDARLISCHSCHLLCRAGPSPDRRTHRCPRCGATLHQRKPRSVKRTWALLIAASICYIPANVLPVTRASSLGDVQSDTILSGVIYFIKEGNWPIALIIFVASILVPLLKLAILSGLLVSIQRRSTWRPRDRTRIYRLTEVIGRWSMVDIYVITITVALVKIGALALFEAGPGLVFFGAVVVLTMFAAMSFDPRLIWDQQGVLQ